MAPLIYLLLRHHHHHLSAAGAGAIVVSILAVTMVGLWAIFWR